jgi:hypothetical protein
MTPKTLFTIILKIIGLYFIRNLLLTIPQLLSVILYLKNGQTLEAVWNLIANGIIVLLELLICNYLIFKTDWIIQKLKLTEGFDQEIIPFNMHRSTILSITIMVIGGLILVDEIPNLCRQVYVYIEERRMNYSGVHKEVPYIILSVIKIVIGSLMLAENRRIVSLIDRSKVKQDAV